MVGQRHGSGTSSGSLFVSLFQLYIRVYEVNVHPWLVVVEFPENLSKIIQLSAETIKKNRLQMQSSETQHNDQ